MSHDQVPTLHQTLDDQNKPGCHSLSLSLAATLSPKLSPSSRHSCSFVIGQGKYYYYVFVARSRVCSGGYHALCFDKYLLESASVREKVPRQPTF